MPGVVRARLRSVFIVAKFDGAVVSCILAQRVALCVGMLNKNGYLRSLLGFIRESENISYHVAAGNITKELLGEWMAAVLRGEEDDEELKLKIYNAIARETNERS